MAAPPFVPFEGWEPQLVIPNWVPQVSLRDLGRAYVSIATWQIRPIT